MNKRRIKSGGVYLGRALKLLSPVVWLNAFFDRYTGGPNRPAFFDIDSTFPALNHVTEHQAIIKEELAAILRAKPSIPRYHDIDLIQFSISRRIDKDKDWKILMLYAMGERPAANRSLCPATCALLDHIPDLFQAFFSILDAGKSIPPHTGPYRGTSRYILLDFCCNITLGHSPTAKLFHSFARKNTTRALYKDDRGNPEPGLDFLRSGCFRVATILSDCLKGAPKLGKRPRVNSS